MRGLAALAVFLSHALGMDPVIERYQGIPRFLWDGAAAVDLFFVLSGFVLYASSSFSGPGLLLQNYPGFLVKRVFRLYPLLLVSLGLGLLCQWSAEPLALKTELSDWARGQWGRPAGVVDWLHNSLLILPGTDVHAINPVIWSLAVEMKMSLLLPLLFVLVDRARPWVLLAVLAGLSGWILAMPERLPGPVLWCPPFLAGALLARCHGDVLRRLARTGPAGWSALIVLGVVLYGNRYILPRHDHPLLCDLLSTAGSVLLMLVATGHAGVSRWLRRPLLLQAGRLSYGLYLLHMPVLFLVVSHLSPAWPLALTGALTLGLTLLLAHHLHRWIELPGMALGRQISRWRGLAGRPA